MRNLFCFRIFPQMFQDSQEQNRRCPYEMDKIRGCTVTSKFGMNITRILEICSSTNQIDRTYVDYYQLNSEVNH